jgi:hypothetical protein
MNVESPAQEASDLFTLIVTRNGPLADNLY